MLTFCFQTNEPLCVAWAVELLEQRAVRMVGGHPENQSEWGGRFQFEKERRGGLDARCDRGQWSDFEAQGKMKASGAQQEVFIGSGYGCL